MNNRFYLIWRILFVCVLLSPFAFFSSGFLPWFSGNPAGTVAQEIIYPLEAGWDGSLKFLTRTWNHYFSLSHAAQENTMLRSKLNQLEARLLDYDEKYNEIRRLRDLLQFARQYPGEHEVAEVVGTHAGLPFQSMRISKGSRDGIEAGMPVITGLGVLGKVVRTGLNFSDVQILTDTNFHLDVLLQRTRIRGILRGLFNHSCELKLNRQADIRIGDTVITSGIVGGFPKGLPVGQVVRINYASDNVSQTINVEPWVMPDRVEEVIILKRRDRTIRKIIDTAGKEWMKKSMPDNEG